MWDIVTLETFQAQTGVKFHMLETLQLFLLRYNDEKRLFISDWNGWCQQSSMELFFMFIKHQSKEWIFSMKNNTKKNSFYVLHL